MSILDPFTKPKWQHDDPEVREAAIGEIDDPAVLVEMVREDPEPQVQAAALTRISQPEILDELAATLPTPLQQQARAQRLEQLLPDKEGLASIDDDDLLARIAGLTDDPDLMAAAVSRVKSIETRMELARTHPAARVRLLAARGIEQIDLLRELMLQTRHKDKAVYRHCKDLVDAHHAAEKAEAELEQQLQRIADDAAALSAAVDSPEYKARYQTLASRWKDLQDSCDTERRKTIQDDLEICRTRVEKKEAIQAAETEKQQAVDLALKSFADLVVELEGINPSAELLADRAAVRELGKRLDDIEDRWLASLHHAQPPSELTAACKKLLQQWRAVVTADQRILDSKQALEAISAECGKVDTADFLALKKLHQRAHKLAESLSWPDAVATMSPKAISGLQEDLARIEEMQDKLRKKEKKNLDKLESAFEELRKELNEGHFKNADRAHNRVRNILRQLMPAKQEHYQHELAPLTARLREIHDWQGFAIEPKKQELIAHMQALVGSDEDPDSLATKIKALQDEWKKLGPISPRRDQALWKQFKAAADEAYAPCKEAFSKQAELRRLNFKRRMEIIAQLEEYEKLMAWPDAEDTDPGAPPPDWRLVQKTLDTARKAFNDIKPLDRKGEGRSRKALKKVGDRIYKHVKQEYERNIEIKKDLVERARQLVEQEDLKEAINGAKAIQREWKEVGITPVKVDRGLWKEFRASCDAVFGRLDAQREERNAEVRERKQQAALRKQQALARWPNLMQQLRACAMRPDDAEKATSMWEKEGKIPQGIDTEALEAFWESGPGDTSENDLREACIAMEVFAGIDSPPEDKEARMAYQMKHLFEGSGGQGPGREERLVQLLNEFNALGPGERFVVRFGEGVRKLT